ncbi:MAG: hypothetical protein HWN68_17855 [Desulfobacterales bacterium]|nr:hypothetical protein [Desulfobacterales bacterium]
MGKKSLSACQECRRDPAPSPRHEENSLKQNVVSLKGILKGVEISEKDIKAAKKSLYSKVEL